ncbi:M23 family metallopeptidase [Robertmurraya yapensis]|uniref:M23 family metallopeptidase n=1 Tax=Bacillus yapensis TaxID=2492960 RepID=A0A431VQS2_9BACI|nr:M23 family metallopeptidase [Bacillus yapensis]RTR25572.1 M23 family metallopeptidase [Bacillus yapensis]TKS93435.1 M23 family metallopeptidase [Bacillus yapensis]
MNTRFKSLSKLTGNGSKGFKKITFSVIALTTLTLGVGAHVFADLAFNTVYYVYVDDDYVGTVSDKKIVENIVDNKVEDKQEVLDTKLNLTVGPELTYVPEHVFQNASDTDDQEVIQKLDELLSIKAVATEISFGEGAQVYVKDSEVAKQVIEALKLKYVTKEQLEQLEQQKTTTTEALPPLKENETRILDIKLSKEVTYANKKVAPSRILTADEAVDYILKGTLEEKKYKVQVGDALSQIASNHDMSLEQLLTLNPELQEDDFIKVDQELNVTSLKPLVEVMVEKEVFLKEAIPYDKIVEEDESMYKGDTEVKQEGKDGSREVTYKISEHNGVLLNKEMLNENILEKPTAYIVVKGTKVIPSRGDGTFAWPAVGGYISSKQGSRWGKFHKGIDIARPSDRTIKAADNGIVKFAGNSSGYGNKVVIDHQNGYETVYAHLSSINVSVGETVSKGSKIGVMGSTGNSTGIHLHFEIYKNGNLENPLDYL